MEKQAKFRTILESKRVLRMPLDGIDTYLDTLRKDKEKSDGKRKECITLLIDLIEQGLENMEPGVAE